MKRNLFGGVSLAVMTALWTLGCGSDAFTVAPIATGGAGGGGASGAGVSGSGAGGASAGHPGGGSVQAGGSAQGGVSAAGSGELGGEAGEGGVSPGAGSGGVTPTGGVSGAGGATSGGDGGSGGVVGGNGGDGGSGGVVGGNGGDGGSGGIIGGNGGNGNAAGAAGQSGAAGGCANPLVWFPDSDGDGFGRSSGQVVGCDPPDNGVWVVIGGDCNDDNVLVFPKNKAFYGDSYVPTSGGDSYDYDCANGEQSDPSQYGAASACNNVLACSGVGFVSTGRKAPGQNALCGSTSLSTCVKSGLSCTSVVTQVDAHRCH